ncbi:hypothetical protein KC318_g7032 [Hortaea werneckii]|nr:hypothetical protein KC334_g7237 [Hortaea werneckii]KAI7005797.1 hypothetical protein KC355_g8049 [Hortaea werneckii]KAI7665591.1 hypothetical protein KC318_g7032 [Hortaea werneckii]
MVEKIHPNKLEQAVNASDNKVLVYNFEKNAISSISKQELYHKAGGSRNVQETHIPKKPGRLPIRVKDECTGDSDMFIASVNIGWHWRLQRLFGKFDTLYMVGSI